MRPMQRNVGNTAADNMVTVRSQIIQGQTMMEIKIAFLALAFFAAFMAARSLTAYFSKK
jgi:hypothetical protein